MAFSLCYINLSEGQQCPIQVFVNFGGRRTHAPAQHENMLQIWGYGDQCGAVAAARKCCLNVVTGEVEKPEGHRRQAGNDGQDESEFLGPGFHISSDGKRS